MDVWNTAHQAKLKTLIVAQKMFLFLKNADSNRSVVLIHNISMELESRRNRKAFVLTFKDHTYVLFLLC